MRRSVLINEVLVFFNRRNKDKLVCVLVSVEMIYIVVVLEDFIMLYNNIINNGLVVFI